MMKDKLEKTGHKKAYYRARTALGVFAFALASLSLAAIPVGITYQIAETQAKAENASSSLADCEKSEVGESEKAKEEPKPIHEIGA